MVAGREAAHKSSRLSPRRQCPWGGTWSSSRWAETDDSGARTTAVDENPPIRFDPQDHMMLSENLHWCHCRKPGAASVFGSWPMTEEDGASPAVPGRRCCWRTRAWGEQLFQGSRRRFQHHISTFCILAVDATTRPTTFPLGIEPGLAKPQGQPATLQCTEDRGTRWAAARTRRQHHADGAKLPGPGPRLLHRQNIGKRGEARTKGQEDLRTQPDSGRD